MGNDPSPAPPRTRRRDHRPRFTSPCPNPDDCERFGHYDGVVEGDACECCGQPVGPGTSEGGAP